MQFSNALRKKIEPTTVPLQCEGFEKYPSANVFYWRAFPSVFVCKCPPLLVFRRLLNGQRQSCALIDCPLCIELTGFKRAANQMRFNASRFQWREQFTQGHLTRTQHNGIDLEQRRTLAFFAERHM